MLKNCTMAQNDEDKPSREQGAIPTTWLDIVDSAVWRLTHPFVVTCAVTWIGLNVLVLLIPLSDRKEVALAVISDNITYVIIILLLLFSIVVISLCWYLTSREKNRELERVAKERDELQRNLDCPTGSSEL